MSDKDCIWILLCTICHFSCSRCAEIKINHLGSGLLGGNETELTCTFTTTTEDNVLSLSSLAISAKNATGTFEQIAQFIPPSYTGLTTGGKYLEGRVTLNSSFTSSFGQLKISFQYLTCGDEKEYNCRLILSTTAGQILRDSETTNISVQASPLHPDTVSEINSTQMLEENKNVTFKCAGNIGKPPKLYYWQKIRQNAVTKNYTVTTAITKDPDSCTYNGTSFLTINLTSEDNLAIMRCTVHSMPAVYKDGEALNVLYKVRTPTITKQPNQTYYVVGSGDIELTCHADGNPRSSYKWFKDDNMNQILSSNDTFVIDSNNTTNNGTFLCQAFNSLNGRIHNQTQSVDIFLAYIIPASTPTSTFPTGILKAENKAFCEEDYCKILFGVGAGIVIGLVLAIIFGIVRFHRKNSEKLIDTDDATLRNNLARSRNGSASMNKGYEETETLPMSSMKKTDRKGTSSKENKTLNYVEVDFVGDETSEITKDKKPVQEHPAKKNETVYSVVQKTKSVGNRKERMFTEERHGLQRDEDDPYADNNEVYDHLGNSRHKPNTAGEIFDHQQSSPEAKNSMKF